MAFRLQGLAATVPLSLQPHVCHSDTRTTVTMDDLDNWQATALRLEKLRSEAASLDDSAASEAVAGQAERECAEAEAAAKAIAKQLAAEVSAERKAHLEEQQAVEAALADASQRAAAASATAKAAESRVRRRAAESSESLADLRKLLVREAQAAKEAQSKADNALVARDNAKDLPALKKRHRAVDSKVDNLKEECVQLRRQIEGVRTETDTQSGNGSRAEVLEARISQLEGECQAMTQDGGSSSASHSGVGATADVAAELTIAQDCNRSLLSTVKNMRAERDEAQAAMSKREKEKESLESRFRCNRAEIDDIELQLSDHISRRAKALHEVEQKRSSITVLEQRARDVEEDAKASQKRHSEAWSATRTITLLRQRHEQTSTLLEWRLQNALAQLEKVKPGAPLSRCLMTSRPREKLNNIHRPRPSRFGDSDAGSEITCDADVSTTAGESAAEALLDLGHACA